MTLQFLSDQMSEAEREALDDQQQQTGQHQVLNLKGKKDFFLNKYSGFTLIRPRLFYLEPGLIFTYICSFQLTNKIL